MKKILNSTIFALVAAMLGRQSLVNKDGKLELSEEDEKKIANVYGQTFLDNLKASDGSDESAATIFDAMIADAKAKGQALEAKNATISQLQETVNTLSQAPEQKPAAAPASVAAAPAKAVLNMSAKHNAIVAQALASGNPAQAFAQIEMAGSNGIDVNDLNSEFGTVMPPKVKLDILSQRIYNGFNDAKHFTKITSNTNYKATSALMTEVSQQFTSKWTPKGKTKFTPVEIQYRRHKINVSIVPADILKSWLTYLYEQGKTVDQMPITKYIIENHILPKVADDITLSMIGKGKFVEVENPQDGDEGSAAVDSMDGFETILVEGRKNPNCKFNFFKAAANPFEMTDTELLAYVDSFVDAISPLFAKRLVLHCSPEFLTRYRRADYNVNGKYTGEENAGQIRFTSFTLVPMESMYNSPILFATPKENFVMLVDYAAAERCINDIQRQDYGVKIFGEYSLSTGFLIAEAVYAAVPEGYDPQDSVASGPEDYSDAWEHGKSDSSSSSSSSSSSEESA